MMLVRYDIAADHEELRATPVGEPFAADVTSFTETDDGRTAIFSRVLPPDLGFPIRGMVYFYNAESDEEWAVRTTTGPRPWSMATSPSGDAIASDDLGNVYCFSTRTADVQWVTHLVEPEE